ncbi:hypothetical protein B9479_008384, partial [Cryptococcus floricola]
GKAGTLRFWIEERSFTRQDNWGEAQARREVQMMRMVVDDTGTPI